MRTLSGCTAAALLLAACSGEAPDPQLREPTLLEVDATSPSSASFAIQSTVPVAGAIEAIGASRSGAPIVAVDHRVYELVADVLEWRPLYTEDDGTALVDITAIAPRSDGGAWIAADGRLFVLDGLYVLTTPIELGAGAIHAVDEVDEGPLAGLWIATAQGLFRRTDQQIEAWTIPDTTGPVTGVAVEDLGRFGVAIVGGEAVTLEAKGTDIVTERGVVDLGDARDVAASRGAVWIAGQRGVVRFDATAVLPYRHYTLDGDADVLAVATDPVSGAAWTRTAGRLVEIDGPTLRAYSHPMAADQTAALTVDALGGVFSAGEGALSKATNGAPGGGTSFATDLKPWITENCSQCHRNQTQDFEDRGVFAEVAEEALFRVKNGDMPRCGGGVRCPEGEALDPSSYAVLEQWLRDGKME